MRKTDLINFAGKVAIGVSIAIVLAFIALIALAVFCVGIGAVSSVTNPHVAQDTQQDTNNYRRISATRRSGSPVQSRILPVVYIRKPHFSQIFIESG